MNFVARQIKSRLELDKRILLEMTPLCIQRELWKIVCEYTCEDPRIVDLIVNNDWCIIGRSDFDGRMKLARFHCGKCGLYDICYELLIDDGIHWCVSYGDMFEILLMLPQISPNGCERECFGLSIHDVRMRELLYESIK
jgi:hypothetical protein